MELFLSNQWLVFVVVTVVLFGAAELGYRRGYRLFQNRDEPRKSQIGNVQGALLGMLGLLVGFTFAIAASRYESRRDLVLREANAIGTTFLRASFLPEPHRAEVERLLRRYTEVRLDVYTHATDREKRTLGLAECGRIQRELWAHTVAVGKESPSPIVVSFIQSLNEMIDLDAARITAGQAHVPAAVWVLVLLVAAAGCGVSGYQAGASGARGAYGMFVLPLLVSTVITLICDLDHPHGGFIGISQQPLQDLQKSFPPL